MSVEINELLVRVEVTESPGGEQGRAASPAAAGGSTQREALIAECVERIMEILRQREER